MTWRDIDNVVLGGALQGIGGVAGELLSAAGDRALAHGMNHATGLVVGFVRHDVLGATVGILLAMAPWAPFTKENAR